MSADGLARIRGNPSSNEVYERLVARLDTFAEYEVEVKKTSLHIVHGTAFLGVHPRKAGLLLNIVTRGPIESPRVRKTERVSASRCHNEVAVDSEADLSDEILQWVRDAYQRTLTAEREAARP